MLVGCRGLGRGARAPIVGHLSWAIVSLNTIAKAETMSALRCLIAKEGDMEVKSSEKQVSLLVCRCPEDEHVVIRWRVGWRGSVEPISSAVRSTSKTRSHMMALVTSPWPMPLPAVK